MHAVVLLLLVATATATLATHRNVEAQQEQRFQAQAERLDASLRERINAYVQVLRGSLGLMRSSGTVSRTEWDDYVRTLRLDERYPGIKSLSWAPAVAREDLPAFVARVRREQVPDSFGGQQALRDYALRRPASAVDGAAGQEAGPPPVHSPILYVAPWDDVNRRVLGVDMMRDPVRRAVMLRAARADEAVTSPRLRLSGSADDEAGFIIYTPVRRGGQLQGWLTAAFLAETFIRGVDVARASDLEFEVHDGSTDPSGAAGLLHSTAGTSDDGAPRPLEQRDTGLATSTVLPVPGGSWTVIYQAPPGFVPLVERLAPALVGVVGLLVTAAIWLLVLGVGRWRRVAGLLDEQAVGLREARAEAELATRAKSDFLASMSHEIRTPLTAVIASSDALSTTDLDDEQARYQAIIARSSSHLLEVVNDVLDLSRLEAGALQLEDEPYDLSACVADVLELVVPAAESRGVVVVADAPGVRLRGDETRLRQVLLNLVSNAVKFTGPGGEVRVLARVHDERLSVEVVDTGVGISPERIEELFAPFVQAEAGTSRRHGGSGLGLSITRRLVDAMGGVVEAESEPGVGSTFRFWVLAPVVESERESGQEATSAKSSGARTEQHPIMG
ncbi:sensor histidine kinase [Nocardioides nanhaiensis]|uniref:histidine kinase n=1 Tax=Nocardioides nanhaiensis TaxID=1476871 RepID=A0ABP8W4U3_9ACTN